jgi:hypothetical protein
MRLRELEDFPGKYEYDFRTGGCGIQTYHGTVMLHFPEDLNPQQGISKWA